MKIHRYAHRGDIAGVQQELERGVSIDLFDIQADFVNANLCFQGMTPLQCALASPLAGADMVKFLYDRGAKRSISNGGNPTCIGQFNLAISRKFSCCWIWEQILTALMKMITTC